MKQTIMIGLDIAKQVFQAHRAGRETTRGGMSVIVPG